MEGWSGFTDEQLRRFKGQDDRTQIPPQRKKEPRKNPTTNRNKAREKLHQKQRRQNGSEETSLHENQMLSRTNVPKTSPCESKERNTTTPVNNDNEDKRVEIPDSEEGKPKIECDEVKDEVVSKKMTVEVHELNEEEGRSRELTQLELIQKKQMEMEEENRKKKIALTKAINERKKRTQAEAKQLAFIQKELGKLESLLSADVRILREKIESSSFEYNAARRRYEKAEKEFVAAKVHLHKVTDQKEALTEHLYTIIQENENRKANKLAELMEKLNVENIDEFIAASENEAVPVSPTNSISPTQTTDNRIGTEETPKTSNQSIQGSTRNSSDHTVVSVLSTPSQQELKTVSEPSQGLETLSIPSQQGKETLSKPSHQELETLNIPSKKGLQTIHEVDSEVTNDAIVNR